MPTRLACWRERHPCPLQEDPQETRDRQGFAREGARVLRPGGRLAVATFFATPGAEVAERLEILLAGFTATRG